MHLFDLHESERKKLWQELTGLLEEYYANPSEYRVAPPLDREKIIHLARKYDFNFPVSAGEAIRHAISAIQKYGVQTANPNYYGLFNPRPNFASIMADMITATLNPQMAAWSHSPFAIETEHFLVQKFGQLFGFPEESIDGVFCGGGAESNHTALLCAINRAFPDYSIKGLTGQSRKYIIYCSAEAHHSISKAAMMTGLGLTAVRSIPVDEKHQMRIEDLVNQIEQDIADGNLPCMMVATAGTTGSGAIDPLEQIAGVARNHDIWYHVDAAWGGGVMLDPEYRHVLAGIELADSITFDMHKWMSVPMGTSIFLTRDREILSRSFRITAEYMPKEADKLDVTDPYVHSIQWSRRFIGLRTYLSLLIFGWEGYARTVRHQVEMGGYLRNRLDSEGWEVLNDTPLPLSCFTDPKLKSDPHFAEAVCEHVVTSGKSWISIYQVNGVKTLRACITNYATTQKEIDGLITLVNSSRKKYKINKSLS